MQIANIMLAIGGERGHTVPKYAVTASEIAVLRVIHGDEAVFDVEPTGEADVSNRAEMQRLHFIYGAAKDSEGVSIVRTLFPGAAARVFQTLEEIGLEDVYLKPTQRVSTKTDTTKPKREKKADAETAGDDIRDMPGVMA